MAVYTFNLLSGTSQSNSAEAAKAIKCKKGLTLCNGQCVDTTASANNCGGCGITCSGQGALCLNSNCACSNLNGGSLNLCKTSTGYKCVDFKSDTTCNSCTNDCTDTSKYPAGLKCQNGVCDCPSGQKVCNNQCTDITTVSNCGDCGAKCAIGATCIPGGSGASCLCPIIINTGQDEVACNGPNGLVCVDTATDIHNCGTCGNDCTDTSMYPAGFTCQKGSCGCQEGQMPCPDVTGKVSCVQACPTPNGDVCPLPDGTGTCPT